MDEPGSGNHDPKSLRGLAEEALLAGVGAVALTKDRADELVQELAGRGKMTGDDARELVDDVMGRWRGDAVRMSERAGSTLSTVFRELGLVTRREYEELELRLAQVEHRLRLVEKKRPVSSRPAVRQLGRLSEISQVAAKHGFGYFFDTHRPHGPVPAAPAKSTSRPTASNARPPRPADAGRARADLRQVRPAPLDAPGHRSAGHRLRAEGAAGRRHPGRLRRRSSA